METDLAPIVLFVYNRPCHTEQTLNALMANDLAEKSILYIYADGAKDNASADQIKKIEEVRKLIRSKRWCKEIHIVEGSKNNGLADSIIKGVTDTVNKYGRVIVLEDDLVTAPVFLHYMNNALDIYKNDDEVVSIHGYNYPVNKNLPETFFLKGADCWGWATWKRGWNLFEPDGLVLLKLLEKRSLTKEFDFNNSYPYTQMLKDQISGKNDSWAIRWYASAFLKNKLTLYPGNSYVQNIGLDNSGTHCGSSGFKKMNSQFKEFLNGKVSKIECVEDKEARKVIEKYFKKNSLKSRSIKKSIKKMVKAMMPYGIVYLKQKRGRNHHSIYSEPVKSWEEAKKRTTGYAASNILEDCSTALKKVRDGIYPYERDSVTFNEINYSWPLLTTLLMAGKETGKINVMDFGGSLGSSFYQNKAILSEYNLKWNIIEQEKFVIEGNKEFSNSYLSFYESIEKCFSENSPDVVLLSSVLPYLENKDMVLNEILSYKIKYIIIDRTVVNFGDEDLVIVQTVPERIYKASYPLWFLSERKLKAVFQENYDLIFEVQAYTNSVQNMSSDYDEKCYVFKKKDEKCLN